MAPGKPLDIPTCGFDGGDCLTDHFSGHVVPALLAVTVALLLLLSLGSLAIWKYYKVSRAFLSTEMLKLSVGGG